VTAGYPTAEATPNVILSMEKGGADIIELGVPFTDPIADGPTIQTANTVSSSDGSRIPDEADHQNTDCAGKWRHDQVDPADGPRCPQAGRARPDPADGLLQPAAELRRGAPYEGLQRGWR
jgi:hypothetical protein